MEMAHAISSSASPVDTLGIEELFDVTAPVVEVVPAGDKIEVTVTEAAIRLGISKRTMWRKIKAGEFASRYDGKQTYVAIPVAPVTPDTPQSLDDNESDRSRHIRVPEAEMTSLRDELDRLQSELSAVTFRAQYLQGQVDVYEQQFKLLVDRQETGRSWWQNFWSWAFKK